MVTVKAAAVPSLSRGAFVSHYPASVFPHPGHPWPRLGNEYRGLLNCVRIGSIIFENLSGSHKSSPVFRFSREKSMAGKYLLKTEPSEYSFADLERESVTIWDGVSNPVALRHLRQMEPGDDLVIYETGDRKSAIGTAGVISVDATDARNPVVKIKAGKALGHPVSLAEIKANKSFADSPLVRQGRLSVVPLTSEQYRFLTGQ